MILLEEGLDILNSLLDILGWAQSPGQSTVLEGLLLELCPQIHLRQDY